MRTKLSVFCERVMEAGWLAALILEPLFFNVYSSRVFEPDKLSLLRSIALLLIAVWGLKLIEEAGLKSPEGGEGGSLWQRIRRIPLALPTLLLIAVYLLSTILSVVPSTSFWGSYQRLQGTYSTLSYIMIFAVILSALRRREQLERLILISILTSLPIALYGLVQHFQLDPLPWGGDVTFRVASNMGNSIFVAAYMIMIVPLTLRNLVASLSEILRDEAREIKIVFVVGYLLAVLVLIIAWARVGFVAGLLVGTVLIFVTGLFSISMRKPLLPLLWVGVYSVILVAQLVCIFFTQSRGPWIGILAGLFFFALSWVFVQRIRALQWTFIVLAVAGGLFLVALNLPNTPLDKIKSLPYVGRLGRIFETEQGTGKVRVLIWEGAVELIGLHEPIGLPGEKDTLNAIRPLIGYGPESMYVAYNPFYPPDLAHYERRNASPDRSHNETFDALVNTGLIGFLAYFFLFGSLLYYNLKWLGLIEQSRHRSIFLGLGLGGAVLGFLIPLLLDGTLKFTGVGIPFGFIVGVGLYLVISSFMALRPEGQSGQRQLLLIAILSAIVAHFVEIHFGIAIAATRTYFWALAAVLVVVGNGWVRLDNAPAQESAAPLSVEPAEPSDAAARPPAAKGAPVRVQSSSKKRAARRLAAQKRATTPSPQPRSFAWSWAGVAGFALLVGLVLVTLGYDFITNQQGAASAWQVISNSLTVVTRGGVDSRSYGLLLLFLFTWLVGALLSLSHTPPVESSAETAEDASLIAVGQHLKALGIYAALSLLPFLLFISFHASSLQPGADVSRLIAPFFVAVFVMILAVALSLLKEIALPFTALRPAARVIQAFAAPVALVVTAFLIYALNISIVRADIYYKQAKHYDGIQSWDIAIRLYQESIQYAADQDFYYLFLGRAYLEKATDQTDAAQRAALLDRARQTLLEARRLNPLNTDHTANLGRLYRTQGEMTSDVAQRQQLYRQSLEYYVEATTLSPHNAQLYNEWGLVYAMLGEQDNALEKYQTSLSLDERYDQTYLYLGNLYLNQKEYDKSAEAYRKALELTPGIVQAHSALGYIYSQQGKMAEAVLENLEVLKISPKDYASHKNLAILYQQAGQLADALNSAKTALTVAPESEKAALQAFITQVEGALKQGGS